MNTFKPMLASPADVSTLHYSVLASPKLDGIRATVVDGQLLSRTLKPIPNKYIRSKLNRRSLNGLDGELIIGDPTAKDVYRRTTSGVMSIEGAPDFTFYVFDNYTLDRVYADRVGITCSRVSEISTAPVQWLFQRAIHSKHELDDFEQYTVDKGYEGLILRNPYAPYKYGRSTTKEGYLLKLKRFEDSEAYVLGVVEEMHNGNIAQTDELGRTKRSTAKAGKVGKGTMGALDVEDIHTGVRFQIGSGFTAADRVRTDWIHKIVKYKFFPIGVLNKPRHPVYLGDRHPSDTEVTRIVKRRMVA